MPLIVDNSSMTVERMRREVVILPNPLHDPAITAKIKACFTEADGWSHVAPFAVFRRCRSATEAKELERRVKDVLAVVNSLTLSDTDLVLLILACTDLLRCWNYPSQYKAQLRNLQTRLIEHAYGALPDMLRNPLPAKTPDAQPPDPKGGG